MANVVKRVGFKTVLSNAGRSFLRAFGASVLVLSTGVLAAPNLNQAYALGVAALVASVVAGLGALQSFVPQLTTGKIFGAYGLIVDSAIRAFIGAVIIFLPGVLNAPDLSTAKGLATAGIVGAVTAALRAVQGLLTKGDVPSPQTGS
jgi:hypothetical protein